MTEVWLADYFDRVLSDSDLASSHITAMRLWADRQTNLESGAYTFSGVTRFSYTFYFRDPELATAFRLTFGL